MLRMPLVASEVAQELKRQHDAKKLWFMTHTLRQCAAPVTDAVASRTKKLRAGRSGAVREHPALSALALRFEVQVVDGSSDSMLSLCEMVLKRCEELVASSASLNGALVAEASGDRFTIVTGHESPSNLQTDHGQAALAAAYQVALHVMRKLRAEEQNLDDCGVTITMRAGVSSGLAYEGLVGCAQDQLAFFGEPVTEASKLAALAETGQIGISSDCFAR
eukprot:456223-Rhodomonas_salina.1